MLGKLKIISLTLLAVFAPIKAIILTAFVLILADLFTGVFAAFKRKEPITSAGFKRTLIKLFVYQSAIMLGYLAETYLTGTLLPVSKIITSYIGFTEIVSVLENLNSIAGGSLLTALITKLGNKQNES